MRLTKCLHFRLVQALMIAFLSYSTCVYALPQGFVYLDTIDSSIIQIIHYATSHNFIGRPIKGYTTARCIITRQAALALSRVQQSLKPLGLGLKVYDAYRPQTAVNDFVQWSQDPHDLKMQSVYYPRVNKLDLFPAYIATRSGHSRGSTVDVTLVCLKESHNHPIELDMGTSWDYLDPASHTLSPVVSQTARENRLLLRYYMIQAGFKPISTEWWHFTLIDEPFPHTYFNFPVR